MKNKHHYVAIMAGGIGSRFWPMSRTSFPKQFLDVLNTGKTLIQWTYDRYTKFIPAENIFIVTSEEYVDIVKKQLPNLPVENILAEPSKKNTAPCIAYISFKLAQIDPAACFIVAPRDHLILEEANFEKGGNVDLYGSFGDLNKYNNMIVSFDDTDETTYDTPTWNQPELQGLTTPPLYPFNHVRTTESGHIFEVDDTINARRIHEYHASGTNREIIDDGTRVTRIVGDDYEIVVRDKKVIVFGSCSVTIAGDARLRVDGDLIHEILGNYHLSVKGDMISKIEGNRSTEILGSEITQINTNDSKTVGGTRNRVVGSTTIETYGDAIQKTIGGNITEIIKGDKLIATSGKTTHLAGTSMEIGAGTDMTLAGKSTVTVNSIGPITVKGSRVDLNP
jgi:hypothetical protein